MTRMVELSAERTDEVLPMLCTLMFDSHRDGPQVATLLKPFIEAGQLSGHLVVMRS